MHILDLIMFFVIIVLIYLIVHKLVNDELIESITGIIALSIFTIFHIAYFVYGDYNWIDIFKGTQHFPINIQL